MIFCCLSTIGKGLILYFICPATAKRSRKLYFIGRCFLHREAFKGCMYEKQTQSQRSRYLDKTLDACLRTENLFEQLYKKHFKKTYAGKPTKKYLKIYMQIKKAESISLKDAERFIYSMK